MSAKQASHPKWANKIYDRLFRSAKSQVAALCFRRRANGPEVLLITSRDTGRWIVPKGWPIKGLDNAGSAMQEAWEEAGVRKARVKKAPLGIYRYIKRRKEAADDPVETTVFAAEVIDLKDDFPEAGQRKRKWVSPREAAKLVAEPDLSDILLSDPKHWISGQDNNA